MTPGPTRTGTRSEKTRAVARRSTLGRHGEDVAAGFFAARGYQIVARNVRADRVELDLIVRRGDALVFVEVKTRRGSGHGEAAEAVDPRKQCRLRRGARAWLASRPPEALGVRRHRFDVITCILLADGIAPLRASAPSRCDGPAFPDRPDPTAPEPDPRNATSAPDGTRWSIEHWESAF